MKRAFDIVVSVATLLILLPLFLALALAIKIDSPGPIFFRQRRVGRGFLLFSIYKFRTMVVDAPERGLSITPRGDPRITHLGHYLRKTKIDELPQLLNILIGNMSFVGPRPEVPSYVELFRGDYEELLKVRPGLTDLASLKYRDESAILARAENPQLEYISRLLPDKIRLSKEYIRRSSFVYDLALIFETLRQIWTPRRIA
jgi:lipopolysaccharide/colanic/teichoic acid biosynthesis glycosyltransferase